MARLNGKDKVLLVQATDAALGAAGYLVGDETEHSHSLERELLDEQTKYGRILGPGQLSESFDLTFYADTTDPGQAAILDSIREGTQLKVWDVEKVLTNGKHNTIFAYVYVESVETSSPTDGFVEVSATVQVINQSKRGQLETADLPPNIINFGDYDFQKPGETTGEFGGDPSAVVPATSVLLTPTTATISAGTSETTQLTATVVPATATNKAVTYVSSAPGFATVSATGLVTAVAEGEATITVTTTDGGFTATSVITVTA